MVWLHQHVFALVTVGIGLVSICLAWLQWRKHERPTTSVEHSHADGAVLVTGSHNTVAVGTHPIPPTKPRLVDSQAGSPNLVYVGAKRRRVYVDRWPTVGICDPVDHVQQLESCDALVLKFENRLPPERKIGSAHHVIAKLKFWHKDGRTWREIDYGVWLNSPRNNIDIGIGDTRELVLMCMVGGEAVTFEDKRIDSARPFFSEPFSYLDSPNIDDYDRVEVVLIDQSTQASLTTHVRFWREGNHFCTDL